jgi:predicted RNA-binding protein YlxR (DUF448 family)
VSAPGRTCVGCGTREADRSALVRLRIEGTDVIVDPKRQGGRGAWLHPSAECLERALRRRAFARVFRRADLRCDAASLHAGLTGNARKH